MLRPTKHSHPDKTVVNVAYVLLSFLKKMRVADFTRLRGLARRANRGGDVLLLPALILLYLLGLIEYHAKNDSFEYLGQQ
jgi:hypothetical protein